MRNPDNSEATKIERLISDIDEKCIRLETGTLGCEYYKSLGIDPVELPALGVKYHKGLTMWSEEEGKREKVGEFPALIYKTRDKSGRDSGRIIDYFVESNRLERRYLNRDNAADSFRQVVLRSMGDRKSITVGVGIEDTLAWWQLFGEKVGGGLTAMLSYSNLQESVSPFPAANVQILINYIDGVSKNRQRSIAYSAAYGMEKAGINVSVHDPQLVYTDNSNSFLERL